MNSIIESEKQMEITKEIKEFNPIMENKILRQTGDHLIQVIKSSPRQSAERTLAIRKFQEGVMWLGMDLKALNEPNPYPSSKDPSTGNVIEPTADGLKL